MQSENAMTQLLSMQVGRHELQPGEGVDCGKEGAGGSLGGEGAAWGGCFFLLSSQNARKKTFFGGGRSSLSLAFALRLLLNDGINLLLYLSLRKLSN